MHEATVGHLLRENGSGLEVLLGERSSLFCDGTWNGAGGKFEVGEDMFACARREALEEIGVKIIKSSTKHFASIDFYHPSEKSPSGFSLEWRVHFFRVTEWRGEPRCLKGFWQIKWFPIHALPYELMMIDCPSWLPVAIHRGKGKLLLAEIFYGARMETVVKGSFRFVDLPSRGA